MSRRHTYNRLNKDDAVILLVDHMTSPPNEFKNNMLALADVVKYFELPNEQSPYGALVPELKEMFPGAPYVTRPGQINAWDNQNFVKAIKATGRK